MWCIDGGLQPYNLNACTCAEWELGHEGEAPAALMSSATHHGDEDVRNLPEGVHSEHRPSSSYGTTSSHKTSVPGLSGYLKATARAETRKLYVQGATPMIPETTRYCSATASVCSKCLAVGCLERCTKVRLLCQFWSDASSAAAASRSACGIPVHLMLTSDAWCPSEQKTFGICRPLPWHDSGGQDCRIDSA